MSNAKSTTEARRESRIRNSLDAFHRRNETLGSITRVNHSVGYDQFKQRVDELIAEAFTAGFSAGEDFGVDRICKEICPN